MPILDVVEFLDPIGDVLAARVPEHSSGEFRLGSQCVVRDGQVALFCRDGRALDLLGPGRHTLTSNNIPLLIDLLSLPFGGRSPFRADVYFINLQQQTDLRWGTAQPLPVRDPQLGIVRLRAHGTAIIQIDAPRSFYTALLGTRGRFTRADIEEQLRSIVAARLADTLAEQMIEHKLSVLDLAAHYTEIASAATEALHDDFAAMGFRLSRFYINTISVPEEVERRMDQFSGVQMFGGIEGYTRFKAAEALGDAAKNGDGAAGTGIGLGAGMQLGQVLAGSLGSSLAAPQAAGLRCQRCSSALAQGARFCANCGAAAAAPSPTTCPGCQAAVAPDARFCSACGTALR